MLQPSHDRAQLMSMTLGPSAVATNSLIALNVSVQAVTPPAAVCRRVIQQPHFNWVQLLHQDRLDCCCRAQSKA